MRRTIGWLVILLCWHSIASAQISLDSVATKRYELYADIAHLPDTTVFNDYTLGKKVELLRRAIMKPVSVFVLDLLLDKACVDLLDSAGWPFERFENIRSLALGGINDKQWLNVIDKVKDHRYLHHLRSGNVALPTIKNLWTLEISLPDTIMLLGIVSNQKNIKYLSIHGALSISQDIGSLTQLEYLYIKSSRLYSLPDEMCGLKSLLELSINAPITRLPSCIGDISNLTNMNVLGTSKDSVLTELPSSMSKLVNLKSLEFLDSDFPRIPEVICKLVNLQILRIQVRDVKYIPEGMQNIRQPRRITIHKSRNVNPHPKTVKRTTKRLSKMFPGCSVDVQK